MNFRIRVWRIERAHPGRYLNSPLDWRFCGYIRARSQAEALAHAEEAVRFGTVRVQLREATA